MKRLIGFLSVATLAIVLAVPLAAQTFRVTATVPFEFMVAGRFMPAGDYSIGTLSSNSGTVVQVSNSSSGVISLVNNSSARSNERTGQALLIFHRYGDQYFLFRIVDGSRDTGLELPTSHTEKELSKIASIQKFETIAVLARR
jgi:hypothetical protein